MYHKHFWYAGQVQKQLGKECVLFQKISFWSAPVFRYPQTDVDHTQ